MNTFDRMPYLLPGGYLLAAVVLLVYRHTPLFIEPEGMFEISISNFILGHVSYPSYGISYVLDYLFGTSLTPSIASVIRTGNNREVPLIHIFISTIGYYCIGLTIKTVWKTLRKMMTLITEPFFL